MRKYIILLTLFLFIFTVGCNKNSYTKNDVLKIIDEKGADNLDWKDFEHIEHTDVGFGGIVNVYKLDENTVLILAGNGYDSKPYKITIEENGKITNIK